MFNKVLQIQQLMNSGKNPNEILEELKKQNPNQFNAMMKQLNASKMTPQQIVMNMLGQNNPIFQLLLGMFKK